GRGGGGRFRSRLPPPPSRMTRVGTAAAVFAVAGLAGACTAARAAPADHVVTIHLTAHHSHWSASHLNVPDRTRIRIVVRNDDPIDHEFIVGDGAVQDRHERGTEAKHPPRPGEISIPAGTTVETTVWFPETTTLQYGCHLP